MVKAVVDVGSNSVLLLVERRRPDGSWEAVLETSHVTSLGAGTKSTGLLSEAGMARTLEALRDAYQAAERAGASDIVAGVTMAGRIARNSEEFLSRAEAQGTPATVLSGDEEARLGFLSVAEDPMFAELETISIVDVGGQSTELVTASRVDGSWQFGFRRSYPVGTLALRGEVLSQETPDHAALLRASASIDEIAGVRYLPGKCGRAITLGATGTNLVTMRDRILEWDPKRVHGSVLTYEEISKSVGRLSALSDSERAQVPGIEMGREQTIHIGALILERFLFAIGADSCFVSVRGWRHALLELGRASG